MKGKKRRELITIVASKAILSKNVTQKTNMEKQIQRFFTSSHNKQN